MGNFIRESSFFRRFYRNDDFGIVHFGYDDFTCVTPWKSFRVQSFYTWHFVLSGCGTLEIGGKTYRLSEGDTFFIPPDTEMRYFPEPDDPWEYVWFGINGSLAAQYGNELQFSVSSPVRQGQNFPAIKQVLYRTVEALREQRRGYYTVMAAFYEVMSLSTVEYRVRTPIQAVRDLIDESFMLCDFSVEKICHDVSFSHAQLLRLFKKEYGKTIMQYVLEKRLSLAAELLERTDVTVRTVAASVGFIDEIHFMKSFKKRYGMTASEFRKNYRKTLSE